MKRAAALVVVAAALVFHLAERHRAPVAPAAPAARAPSADTLPRIEPLLVLATRLELPKVSLKLPAAPRAATVGERIPVQLTQYCLRGITRIGKPVAPGLIAADPRVFPLGHHVDLFVGGEHYGRFLVADIGRAVQGRVIDIWTPRCTDALRFGRKRGTAVLVGRSD